MLAQERPAYRLALRNALTLHVKRPGLALSITLFNAAILAVSLWWRFPWLVLSTSLPALMACA